LSLARTSCRLWFTARPTARSLAELRDVVRSRNPSKSTLAHDAVATAVLHKHHPIIHVGAGLIQFVYRSHLRLATEATRNRNAFSLFFPRVFSLSRNDAHVCDLDPASSNSSVCLVSFRIVAISACSWPFQHSCFFRKFHPSLVIVHPRPGSRHVVRPSVVMILVSCTRSSHICDESKILTKISCGKMAELEFWIK